MHSHNVVAFTVNRRRSGYCTTMPWQKKGSMKYELVEAYPKHSSPVKSSKEVAATASNSPSSSVDTEDSSYAASLWSHFALYDPLRADQAIDDYNENAEPNVTRRFFVGSVSPDDPMQAALKSLAFASVGTGNDDDLAENESLSGSEAAPSSGTTLLKYPLSPVAVPVQDSEVLDQIVEVGSITPAPQAKMVLLSDRRIRRLLKVMKRTIKGCDEEEVAKDLRKLADSCLEKASPHRGSLIDHGAVGWIATSIMRFPGSSKVSSRGLRALQNITCGSELAREILQRLNGAHLICQAMRAFENDTKVQRDGCGALLNYLLKDFDASRCESFVRSGGIETILIAIEGHPGDSKLCEWACRCIQALCKTCKHHRPEVWSKGGFTAILNAREQHPKCLGIQKAARSATRMFWNEYETITAKQT
jgi:hypothetical protein